MTDYLRIEEALKKLRQEYQAGILLEQDADLDPFRQFAAWFEEAVNKNCIRPDAMSVATADPDGKPSVRKLLLKGFGPEGFVFFTNYASRKGKELMENPRAALDFFWPELERQVIVEGAVEELPREFSARYFASRPEGARLAVWSSRQSEVIADRKQLEEKAEEMRRRFRDKEIPCPEYWGGYRVIPELFEFWQGRENRLNDRLRYRREQAHWVIERLAP